MWGLQPDDGRPGRDVPAHQGSPAGLADGYGERLQRDYGQEKARSLWVQWSSSSAMRTSVNKGLTIWTLTYQPEVDQEPDKVEAYGAAQTNGFDVFRRMGFCSR